MIRRGFIMVTAIWGVAACDQDPVLSARQVLEEEPARAATILEQAARERPDCFNCWLFLGLAREKGGDLQGAVDAYEHALALDEAGRRPEPVADRLLWLYDQVFTTSNDAATREAIARKAAPLEARLGAARPWANDHLHDRLLADFRNHVAAGRRDEALAAARAIQGLYLAPDKKAAAAREATAFLREEFARRGAEVIRTQRAEALAEKGFLDGKHKRIVLRHDFRVPTRREDPAFDPGSDAFPAMVRARACLPLRQRLGEVVALVREDLKIRAPSEEDLDRLFAKMFTYARAGWARFGAERNPAGESFLCRISVPVEAFVAELFRFSE